MCKDAPNCTRRVCFFAHDCSELRDPDPADKEALELAIVMNGGSDATGEDTGRSGSKSWTGVGRCVLKVP